MELCLDILQMLNGHMWRDEYTLIHGHFLKFKAASAELMRRSSSPFERMNFKGSQAPGLKSDIIIWDLNLL